MHRFKAKHFPALDGLRGFAILLVCMHHQLIPISLRGGFLSVDLFFALSGFLITTLLLTEFDATQKISLKNFYMRRALRLGPALLLYLTAVLVVTWRLTPNEFAHQAKLVGFSLCYLTNWRMALGWDHSLDLTAITWSLSVEEQFYLLWPCLLLLCFKLKIKRSYVVAGLTAVILYVLFHRFLLMKNGSELTRLYYGADTRADAPLLGCLVALLPPFKIDGRRRLFFLIASTWAMFVYLYLVLTTQFTDYFLYLGGYTFVAVITAIITWGVANMPNGYLSRLLSWSPLRWLGRISYPLYLWHWLLLKTTSFYFLFGELDPWARCAVAIGIAALSYYLIEMPFNKLKTRYSYSRAAVEHGQPGSIDITPVVSPFSPPPLIQTSGPKL